MTRDGQVNTVVPVNTVDRHGHEFEQRYSTVLWILAPVLSNATVT